ncbi:TRAP transporter large permease [Ruixingdingia sedimenti]|uniref:TRAP transporter large permease protein n=1 Tax=Ruixingdingia sedimenti TaxID=3073604 RepID=A0ABU1F347_9RHOB|nr:TRAP transporter large permease [Xinfangfangia sp. LG-4]MDR5651068.1 TRAP transporter large permease [Xinfangfangia sp. LG-4]
MIAAFGFVGLFILGLPVVAVLLAAAVILIAERGDWVLLESLPQQLVSGIDSYGLMALPLFILLGEAMAAGGTGRRLMRLALVMAGPVRGGLAHVNLAANVMLAAILGSAVAQLTVMTRMAVPEMEAAGYPRDEAVAVTAAGSLLAPVLPPSMMFIIYGVMAQVPIGALFIAGIVPGILLAAAFLGVIAWRARRVPYPPAQRMDPRARRAAVLGALPAATIPALVVASIAAGIATPTEAGALAAALAIVLGLFVHREMGWRDLPGLFVRAGLGSAAVLLLIATAQVLAWVLAYAGVPGAMARMLSAVTDSPVTFLLMMNLLLFALGTVLEPVPALTLTVPVLLPVGIDVYGIDPVHLGVVICVNLALGLLTPPVGAGLFAAAALSGVSVARISWVLMPYLLAAAAVLLGLSVWPYVL